MKRRSERNLTEGIWRAYRRVLLLDEEGDLREIDLGLLHPSASESLVGFILLRLKHGGLLEETVTPDFLVRHWPPALEEWSTKTVRDIFFASPQFPRLLNADVVKDAIAEGVHKGKFGYVAKADTGYEGDRIIDDPTFRPTDVEISDEVVLVPPEKAIGLKGVRPLAPGEAEQEREPPGQLEQGEQTETTGDTRRVPVMQRMSWEGNVPAQLWTNFDLKVLSRFATEPSLRIRVRFEVAPEAGMTRTQEEETRGALRELGLDSDNLEAE